MKSIRARQDHRSLVLVIVVGLIAGLTAGLTAGCSGGPFLAGPTPTAGPPTPPSFAPPPFAVTHPNWPGDPIEAVYVRYELDFPEGASQPPETAIPQVTAYYLDLLGLTLAADPAASDAALTLTLRGEPLRASYTDGTCYTGAQFSGTLELTSTTSSARVSVRLDATNEPPASTESCPDYPGRAVFDWERVYTAGLAALWGEETISVYRLGVLSGDWWLNDSPLTPAALPALQTLLATDTDDLAVRTGVDLAKDRAHLVRSVAELAQPFGTVAAPMTPYLLSALGAFTADDFFTADAYAAYQADIMDALRSLTGEGFTTPADWWTWAATAAPSGG